MPSDLQVTNIKANDGTSGLVIADSTGNVSLNGTLSAGTIGDNVAMSSKYWCQIKFSSGQDVDEQIRFTGDGTMYAVFQSGSDTTNFVQGTDVNDLKIVRAGVYLVIFTLSANLVNEGERNLYLEIRGTGSNSTTVLAGAKSQIANPEGATTSGTGTAVLCKAFSANDQINFHSSSASTGNAVIDPDYSSISITLIRPT
tara:strand:- start:13892 stop:14488 length:597 start_codon:yes stop_codon:yes gene_type:complete